MQPSTVRTNPAPAAQVTVAAQSPPSVADSLDAIKHWHDALQSELNAMRAQRDEYESKVDSQVAEMNSMRRSLFELEGKHSRVCMQYEDEIKRLHSELMVARGQHPSSGIPGRSPRGPGIGDALPFSPSPAAEPQYYAPPSRPSTRNHRPVERERDTSSADREFRGKARDDSDRDREFDQRDPKRHKGHDLDVPMGSRQQVPVPSGQSTVKPMASLPPFNNASGTYRNDTAGPSSSTLPPMNISPPEPIEELSLYNVSSEFRKEGADWYAIFNPQVKRALDVNLQHTFIHATVVCCVQFSADGRFVATGCNRTAQIFDVQTGQKICTIQDESAAKTGDLYIRSVRFSPDGKLLATGAEDHKIRVWDIAKRRIRHVFDGHEEEIYSLDFSRDGRYIVSGSGDKTMRIWDMTDQSCRTVVISDTDSHTHAPAGLKDDGGVTSVAISPDGTLVAAGSLDSVIRIWDVTSGALLERLRGHEDSVYSVAFTPDGKGIISGSLDKKLKLWDVTSLVNEFLRNKQDPKGSSAALDRANPSTTSFVGHRDFVLSVSVSHDGRWVVSGSKDRSVHFWDRNGVMQFLLQGHKNSVISLDVNPLGGMLATGSGDNTARIWTYSAI